MKLFSPFPAPSVLQADQPAGPAAVPSCRKYFRRYCSGLPRRPGLLRSLLVPGVLLAALVLSNGPAAAQPPDPELQRLMSRRAELLQKWKRFNLEENALFGGKSKKDLRNILQTQKEIIDLDNRILNANVMAGFEKKKADRQASVRHERSLYGQLDSVRTLHERAAQQMDAFKKREASLKATISRQQSSNRTLSMSLVAVTALLLVSLFYNPFRRKRA